MSHCTRRDEEGSALVLVLIFAIGVLVLVSTLLSLATQGVRDERARRDLKALQTVVSTALADAVFEINADRLTGPFDPAGDGAGALTVDSDGGDGVRVVAPSGRSLGRYRTTIRPDAAGRWILTAVAVSPDFGAPRQRAAARAILLPAPPPFLGDRNALSIIGPNRDLNLSMGGGSRLTITDPSLAVAAVNVTDPEVRESFLAATGGATILGADPENPGAGAEGAGTVTNDPAGIVSEEAVDRILGGVQAFVAANLAGATPLSDAAASAGATVTATADGVSIDAGGSAATLVLPPGTYSASAVDVTTGVTVQGSGTLIVTGDLDLLNGARLDWTGQIIVIGSSDAELQVAGGGRLDVAGLLVVVSAPGAEATFVADSGSRVGVDGALLSLGAGDEGQTELGLDSGSEVDVDGILLLLGNEAEFESMPSGALTVDGSMVVAAPVDSEDGEIDVRFGNGSDTTLTFDNVNFERGLRSLMTFFDLTGGTDEFPVRVTSYWEGSTLEWLNAQEADVDAHLADASHTIGMPQ